MTVCSYYADDRAARAFPAFISIEIRVFHVSRVLTLVLTSAANQLPQL